MKTKLQSVLTRETAIKVGATILAGAIVVTAAFGVYQIGTAVYDRLSD